MIFMSKNGANDVGKYQKEYDQFHNYSPEVEVVLQIYCVVLNWRKGYQSKIF